MATYTIDTTSRIRDGNGAAGVKAKARRDKLRKQIATTSLGVVALLGSALLAYRLWPTPMPSPEAAPAALAKFAATDRFVNLTPDQKQPYLDAFEKLSWQDRMQVMRDSGLSEEQRRDAMGNIMMAAMDRRMDDYFALPQAQRTAFIDNMLKGEVERMRQRPQQAADRPQGERRPDGAQRGGGWRGNDPSAMRRRLDRMSPTRRAQMAEFIGAMAARREALGLPARGGPGGGMGGGRGPGGGRG